MKFLGRDVAQILVAKYDKKPMIPLLVKVSKFLNPIGGNNALQAF
jgi:hypothetical protein